MFYKVYPVCVNADKKKRGLPQFSGQETEVLVNFGPGFIIAAFLEACDLNSTLEIHGSCY